MIDPFPYIGIGDASAVGLQSYLSDAKRMAGEALQDGAKGEMIRVRNLSSRQELQGEVVAPGLVRVPM